LSDPGIDVAAVRNVHRDAQGLHSVASQLRDSLLDQVCLKIEDSDLVAIRGEAPRACVSYPGCAACDDSYPFHATRLSVCKENPRSDV
jgi:hypothetical protein